MRTPRSGTIGLIALVGALLGATAWLSMLLGPLNLGIGLLGARAHLERAEKALERPSFARAAYETSAAQADVRRAKRGLRNGGPLLELARLVPKIDAALGEMDHVIAGAEHSARAASGAVNIAQGALTGPDRILADDPDGEGGIIRLDRIEALGQEVSEVREGLGRARRSLQRIDLSNLPKRLAPSIRRGITQAEDARAVLADAEEGFRLLPGILGADGPRSYLIGMQNPAEQRGTGGAILQFATLEIEDGKPSLGDDEGSASTVYDIDQDRELLEIPLPDDAWYQRGIPDARRFGNANWSPHWPLSAQLLVAYGNASADRSPDVEFRDPDGVITVDPTTVEKVMPAIGSFRLKSGYQITAKNVVDFVLYQAYAKFPNRALRRPVLREVVDRFYKGMLDAKEPSRLMSGFADALADKNMQIYMDDPAEQRFVVKMGWAGRLEPALRKGYAFAVEQNVSGNKLDLFARTQDRTEVTFDGRDALISHETTRTNEVFLPQPSWVLGDAGPLHRPMVNFYAPSDATLEDWSAPEDCPSIVQFEIACRRDTPEPARWLGGPPEHEEAGKKVWSGTIEIPPGRTGSLGVRYRLPNRVQREQGRDGFTLVVQQQPKVLPKSSEIRIQVPEGARNVRAPGFSNEDGWLVWEGETRRDLEFHISWRTD